MFHRTGVHALVDGQFGSTGKGLLAAYIAANSGPRPFDVVVSNAGPNSGHTFWYGDRKVVLKQLPSLAVAQRLAGHNPLVYLSAGAVIDPEILVREMREFNMRVHVSRQATCICAADREAELAGSIAAVAGTRQGVGAALARRVLRDPTATVAGASDAFSWMITQGVQFTDAPIDVSGKRVFLEVSQGFSLGLHSEFYPKVTSRECTVMQGIADARIAPRHVVSTSMVVRTFPIRVGSVDGFDSGAGYEDQRETDWNSLGVAAETTTVTGRVRRVFTFSRRQFREAVLANSPSLVLLNFLNYLSTEKRRIEFAAQVERIANDALGYRPIFLYGFGPRVADITSDPTGRGTSADLTTRGRSV